MSSTLDGLLGAGQIDGLDLASTRVPAPASRGSSAWESAIGLATGNDKIGECAAGLQGNVAGGGVLGCLEKNCIRTCSGLPGGG